MIRILILLAVLVVAAEARAERHYSMTFVRTSAADDAAEMARTGRFAHRGNAGCREGIGMGSTPEEALARCCFNNGRYAIREKAVARGANGRWYAVIRYAN